MTPSVQLATLADRLGVQIQQQRRTPRDRWSFRHAGRTVYIRRFADMAGGLDGVWFPVERWSIGWPVYPERARTPYGVGDTLAEAFDDWQSQLKGVSDRCLAALAAFARSAREEAAS